MRALAFAGLALAIGVGVVPARALADTVKLKSGQLIKGKVHDRGAYILVERDLAGLGGTLPVGPSATALISIRIERHEIATIELDGKPAAPPKDLDVVVFLNGDELAGYVELRDQGSQIVVRGDDNRGEIVVEARQVRAILWSKKAQEESKGQAASVGATVERLVTDLPSKDPDVAKLAREKLHGYGVYALPYLEPRIDDPDPAIRATVREIVEVARLRTYMTPALAERVPQLPRTMIDPDPKRRIDALKEAVVASASDSVPILIHMVNLDKDKDVRAFVFGQLALLGRIQELLELLQSRDGSLRFAAAIGLGDNGILVGIPLLIEALKHEDLGVRKVAIQKLQDWTGEFKGYFADAEPPKRHDAVEAWEAWWAKEGDVVVARSLRGTVKRGEISQDEKEEGLAHFIQANVLWDKAATLGIEGEERRTEMHKVRFLLDKSLERYPHNAAARTSLSVLYYTELGQPAEARKELELVLQRYADDAAEPARLHAHFHLGRISQVEKKWTEAEKHFRLALTIDGKSVDLLKAMGILAFERAIQDDSLDKAARKKLIEESIEHFTAGAAAADQYEIELRDNAEEAATNMAITQPYRAPVFRKSIDQAKRELKRSAADILFLRGRSHAALPAASPVERQRHDARACDDYAAALRLDPENKLYENAAKAWAPVPAEEK